MINQGLQAIKERVRETYPNVLIATEVPYQLASQHPHGIGYRIGYGANPSTTYHAEILFSRMTGPMNAHEREVLAAHIKEHLIWPLRLRGAGRNSTLARFIGYRRLVPNLLSKQGILLGEDDQHSLGIDPASPLRRSAVGEGGLEIGERPWNQGEGPVTQQTPPMVAMAMVRLPGEVDGGKSTGAHRGRVLDVELLGTGRSKAFNRPP